jgi:hypothetical protein
MKMNYQTTQCWNVKLKKKKILSQLELTSRLKAYDEIALYNKNWKENMKTNSQQLKYWMMKLKKKSILKNDKKKRPKSTCVNIQNSWSWL